MKLNPLPVIVLAIAFAGSACTSTKTSLAGSSATASKSSGSQKKVAHIPMVSASASAPSLRSSDGKSRTVRTTAYSCKENELGGKYGNKNACGTVLRYGAVRSAAADWSRYPVGTKFRIVGQPQLYVIDDYGSALVGTSTIDLYKPNLGMMNDWGVRHVDIQVIEWGSLQQSAAILKARTHVSHTRTMYHAINAKLNAVAQRSGATSAVGG